MRKLALVLCTVFSLVLLVGCTQGATQGTVGYEDGTYRGGYIDPAQVEVNFVLKDNKFAEFKFRALGYKGEDYLKTEDANLSGITAQYQALADYLVGKDVEALKDLYTPENIAEDTDVFSAATLRSSKMISAINDALNRGLYALAE